MWRRRRALVWLFGACVIGCAPRPSPRRTDVLSGLIGADESELVAALGPPARRFDQGPVSTLIFERTDVQLVPGLGRRAFRTVAFSCRIIVTMEAGRVRSFDQQGPGRYRLHAHVLSGEVQLQR